MTDTKPDIPAQNAAARAGLGLVLRSGLFCACFYLYSALVVVGATLLLPFPGRAMFWAARLWARGSFFLLKWIAGVEWEARGMQNLPKGACLVASAHQSMWDTMVFPLLFPDPAMVVKRELTQIPFYGWDIRRMDVIAIDRASGISAIRTLIAKARLVAEEGRAIIIFPEGTRALQGEPADYKPGIAALYTRLGIPCVPAGVNSGFCWPRRSFLRRPGRIVLSFGEPIAPGLPRKAFMAELERRIAAENAKLV